MTKDEKDRLPYEIVYLAPAQRDLQRLMDFLTTNEVSPVCAQEIILEIVEKIRVLRENPLLGFSFGGKYGFTTPYRGILCGKYVAVYEPIEASDDKHDDKGGRIEIRRIYHEREDYLTQLRQR